MGLLAEIKIRFALWWKLMEMEEVARQFLEEYRDCRKWRSSTNAYLEFLCQMENAYNRGGILIAEIRDLEERWVNQARSYKRKEARIRKLAQTIAMEKKIKGSLEDISIKRELVMVLKEIGPLSPDWKMAKILTWLGLESPWVKAIRKEAVIGGEDWRQLILEDRWGKLWDDMPSGLRKRYFTLRRLIEFIGGKLYYNVLSEGGTKTVIMFPQKMLELKVRKG